MGIRTSGGTGMSLIGLFSVFLEWATRIPLNVFARNRLKSNDLQLLELVNRSSDRGG